MSPFLIAFVIVNAVALMILPRRWAPLPLLVGTCYVTIAQRIEIGTLHFPIIRILIAVGVVRVITRGETGAGKFNGLDGLMIAWAIWAVLASCFHEKPGAFVVNTLGLLYNCCGIYFLVRRLCNTFESVLGIVKMTAILLVPVALEMISEQITGRNLFALMEGLSDGISQRSGRFRAQGPFDHAILAGTVGAWALPLMIGIWKLKPRIAKIGAAASIVIIMASASSGPLASAVFGMFALATWRWKHLVPRMRIAAIVLYILLDIVMKAPAYFLIARVDLVGGSTGWHRARLIESAIEHIGEWWMKGTDFTRHWMPTGVQWSEDHTDITNHYLAMGVRGGFGLMILFMLILGKAFQNIGTSLRRHRRSGTNVQFAIWSIGAALFVHAASAISVAYFDQTVVFIYLNLGVAACLASAPVKAIATPQRVIGNVAHTPLATVA